jgi:uncharacterized protein (UPF0332 family)
MPPDDIPEDLAKFRLDQARECLQDARVPVISLKNAANRSYYCIFNAMRAVLALDRFDSKKHSGVISAFRKDYIKTGIFPTSFSDIIKKSFAIRGDSDYKEFYLVSKADIAAQIENAGIFLEAVEKYIAERTQSA